MGEIHVDGLGVVEIAGDEPTTQEADAIMSHLNRAEAERTAVPSGDPMTEDDNVGVPVGKGPIGIMPESGRQWVKDKLKDVGWGAEVAGEMAPAMIGGAIGMRGGPFLAAGMAATGEMLAQEIGLAPHSRANQMLAALGPFMGLGAGYAFKLGKRGIGATVGLMPPVRSAMSKIAGADAGEMFGTIGSRILNHGKEVIENIPGVGRVRVKSAGEMYNKIRQMGVKVSGDMMSNTRKSIDDLISEMQPYAPIPEVKQAIDMLGNAKTLIAGDVVNFDHIMQTRKYLGNIIGMAKRATGEKFGTAKKVFSVLETDLDAMARVAPTAQAARLFKHANARAKLEFGVSDLEGAIAKYTRELPKDGTVVINVKGLYNHILDITNPKHAKYRKNFADALKDHLPMIKGNIKELAKHTTTSGAGGPGALVVRGRGASMGASISERLFGGLLGGTVAGGLGAVAGASMPEIISGSLMTKPGMVLVRSAMKAGKGSVNHQAWGAIGTAVLKSAGYTEDQIEAYMNPDDQPEGELFEGAMP